MQFDTIKQASPVHISQFLILFFTITLSQSQSLVLSDRASYFMQLKCIKTVTAYRFDLKSYCQSPHEMQKSLALSSSQSTTTIIPVLSFFYSPDVLLAT